MVADVIFGYAAVSLLFAAGWEAFDGDWEGTAGFTLFAAALRLLVVVWHE